MLFSLTTIPMTRRRMKDMDALQRIMMRRIVGWRRVAGETWQDPMSRMKQRLLFAANIYPCRKWSESWAQAQWRYAIHIYEGHPALWAKRLCKYNAQAVHDPNRIIQAKRSRGHPRLRWDGHIQSFCKQQWPERRGDNWSDTLGVSIFAQATCMTCIGVSTYM